MIVILGVDIWSGLCWEHVMFFGFCYSLWIASSATYLLFQHKVLSLVPKIHFKKHWAWWHMFVILELGTWRHSNPWGSLASLSPCLLSSQRDTGLSTQDRWLLRNNICIWPLAPVHTCEHTSTHTQNNNKKRTKGRRVDFTTPLGTVKVKTYKISW